MSKKLKVLFLSSWFPSRVIPTNGDFVERHAECAAILNDVAVLFVIADAKLNSNKTEIHEFKKNGVTQVIIYFKKCGIYFLGPIIDKIRYFLLYLKGYNRIKKTFGKPDIIHANIIYPIILITYLFSKIFNIPFVFTEHWTIYLTNKIPLKHLSRLLLKNCKVVLPVSQNLAESLRNNGLHNNFIDIPNVVDIKKFTTNKNFTGKFRYIHISSMKEEQKNILGILEAIKIYIEFEKNVRFDFIGRYQQNQIEFAKNNKLLNTFVFFHGEKPHNEIPDFLNKADAFLLFSNYENLPCVIVEAFASGLPVISSSVGGIGEHINQNNGILIEKGDIPSLVNAFEYIKRNYKNFDSEFVRKYAIDNFSSEVISYKLTEIYKNV